MKTFLNAGHDDRAAEVKFYFYDACRVYTIKFKIPSGGVGVH